MTYLESLTADFGKWQFILMITAGISVMNLAPSHLEITFFAPKQEHTCNNFPYNISNASSPITSFVNDDSCSIPYVETENGAILIKDKKKSNLSDIESYECSSWNFDKSVWKRTIVEDFHLVCKRDVLISTSSFVYMVGMMAGLSIFGQLADKYGRRLVTTICSVLWLIVNVVTAFSVNYVMFVTMRFLMASAAVGSMTISYVWCMESLNSKGRGIVGSIISIIWCFGMLYATLVPYITRDWYWSQLVFAALIALYFPAYLFTLESPSWLFSVGRFTDGMQVMKKAANMNGKIGPVDEVVKNDLENTSINTVVEGNSVTFLDLMKFPNLRKKTFIVFYCWFVVSFIYFALTLNTGDLGGDIFINMTIAAILEAIGYGIAIVLLVKIGRRLPTAISFVVAGISCFLVAFIPDSSETLIWLKVSIALVGRTAISISFNNLFVYTSELHPTVVRSVGLGACSMSARIGGMLAPYVKELGKYTNSSVPMLLFAVLSTTAGGICFILPETINKTLPNTLEEGEVFGLDTSETGKSNGIFAKLRRLVGRRKTSKDVAMDELA